MILMKRIFAAILAGAMTVLSVPMKTDVYAGAMISVKFDFGGLGTAEGYIGVSAAVG